MSQDQLDLLADLGLTVQQSKIYLALVTLGTSNAKTLAEASGLPVCDVYRVANQLSHIDLVEALITSPKKCKAADPEIALGLLIERKRTLIKDLSKKANNLIISINNRVCMQKVEDEETIFLMSAAKARQSFLPVISSTKNKLDCIQPSRVFLKFVKHFSVNLHGLAKSNVQIRFLVESRQAIEKPTVELNDLLNYSNVMVRSANSKIAAYVALSDGKQAFLSTLLDPIDASYYCSRNRCLVHVTSTYFETMWAEAAQ
jgi:sugar-specific transcriptional regulator TrmB